MRRHFIEQPVSLHEELSHSGLAEFGDHATSLAQGIKGGRCFQSLDQQALCRRTRVLGDIGNSVVEHAAGLLGPDYPSSPRSHFCRRAFSTSSWGMVRPAATSACPRSTA